MAVATDPRIDAYIADQAEWARPILEHLRELLHQADPHVVETIKWGAPSFDHKGILAVMAAMKTHAMFLLWKGELIPEVKDLYGSRFGESMGTFGRITRLEDLPPDEKLVDWIRQAVALNEQGVKLPQRAREPKPEVETPDDLIARLEANEAARITYEGFPPSKKRDYVEWLTEAKTEATRQKRLQQAIEWMAEGKSRMWKYERK
jgi:hypothetical protein